MNGGKPNGQVLVVSSHRSSLMRLPQMFGEDDFSWTYLGESLKDLRRAKKTLGNSGSYIDPTARFHMAARNLRNSYLEYIYAISIKQHSLRWWISTLSLKFGFLSRTFYRSSLVKTGLDLAGNWKSPRTLVLIADHPVNLSLKKNLGMVENHPLASVWANLVKVVVKSKGLASLLAHRAVFVKQELYRVFRSRMATIFPRSKRTVLSINGPVTLLICWITPENLQLRGKFHETYFGDLVSQLTRLGKQVVLVPNAIPTVPYKAMLSSVKDSVLPVDLPHRRVGILDIIWAAFTTIGGTRGPGEVPPLQGMDIGPIIDDEMHSFWISNGAARCLLLTKQVQAWAKSDMDIERIIYLYENQPWERALCWQASKSLPETTLVGFRHSASPRLMLHFYLAPGEGDLAPLPHRIATIGPRSTDLFTAGGHSADKIREVGGLQLQGMLNTLTQYQPRSPDQAVNEQPAPVLVAVSGVSLEEAADLVDMAIKIFNPEDVIPIVIKFHTLIPLQAIQNMVDLPLPSHVSISNKSLIELLSESSTMIYTTSTSCFQAIALGVPNIHLRSQFQLDLDPLEDVPDLRLEATGLEELRTCVLWLLENKNEYADQHRDQWRDFAAQMYGAVTEDSFLAFID